jgi:membrane-associated phospholipid phosphatase
MKAITIAARILSIIFSPYLVGTYGTVLALWLSYLCYSSLHAKLIVTAVSFVATCAIPMIASFLLYRIGVVKNPQLNERQDRTVPYIICTLCYLALSVYFRYAHAPMWMSLFVLGGAIALVIVSIVNRKWKISGHATGMGALVALMFFLMCSGSCPHDLQLEFIIAVLLAGCVCSARLILERHTLMQVAAGFANGFVCVFLPAWLLQTTTFTPL